MEFEKLALEVSALKAGLTALSPHALQGSSGVEHKFDLLFTDGRHRYAFDFYEEVSEVEVVRSFAKKFDSGCTVNIVCPPGMATDEAQKLALFYNMRVLTPEAAPTFFALEKATPRRTFG